MLNLQRMILAFSIGKEFLLFLGIKNFIISTIKPLKNEKYSMVSGSRMYYYMALRHTWIR